MNLRVPRLLFLLTFVFFISCSSDSDVFSEIFSDQPDNSEQVDDSPNADGEDGSSSDGENDGGSNDENEGTGNDDNGSDTGGDSNGNTDDDGNNNDNGDSDGNDTGSDTNDNGDDGNTNDDGDTNTDPDNGGETNAIVATWNLDSAIIENGTATTTYNDQEVTIAYASTSSNENVQLVFSENPNEISSTGDYTTTISFTILGNDFTDEVTTESPFTSGNWEVQNNTLIISSNASANGSYNIVELTANSLVLTTEVDRTIQVNGLDLDTQGVLTIRFSK